MRTLTISLLALSLIACKHDDKSKGAAQLAKAEEVIAPPAAPSAVAPPPADPALRDDVRAICKTVWQCADDEYSDHGGGCDDQVKKERLTALPMKSARGKQLLGPYAAGQDGATDAFAHAVVEVGLARSHDCSIAMQQNGDLVPTGSTPEIEDLDAMCTAIAKCDQQEECTAGDQNQAFAKLTLHTEIVKALAARLAARKPDVDDEHDDAMHAFYAEALDQGLDTDGPCHNVLFDSGEKL